MRDEAEKTTKSRDDPLVASMHEKMVTESSVVKRIQRQPQKQPKSLEFVETESDVSDDDDEERKPIVKRIQTLPKKAPKSPKLVDTDPEESGDDDEEEEPVLKKATKVPKACQSRPKGTRGLGY